MLPQFLLPVALFSMWNLSGRVMPYMPSTPVPEAGAPQKVTVIVPPGATREGSAITLTLALASTCTELLVAAAADAPASNILNS